MILSPPCKPGLPPSSRASFQRVLLFVLLTAMFCLIAPAANAERVLRVIDGDTVLLQDGRTVRYIGIDAPESKDPRAPVEFMSKQAKAFNEAYVLDREVRLEYGEGRTDAHGRTLAYVYVGDTFVNAELVRAGFAVVMTIPPNTEFADLFAECEQEARSAGRGVWDKAAAADWEQRNPAPVTSSASYYITKSGSKYHRGGCNYLSKSAIPIEKEDAVSRGYGPCSACVGASSGSTKPDAESGGRCLATTKKGTQCKRSAKTGSSYCWQHGS